MDQFKQRITLYSLTQQHASDACSHIGNLVHEAGLTGIPALRMQQGLYLALAQEFMQAGAAGNAIEFIQSRHSSVTEEIDKMMCGAPDLFEQFIGQRFEVSA